MRKIYLTVCLLVYILCDISAKGSDVQNPHIKALADQDGVEAVSCKFPVLGKQRSSSSSGFNCEDLEDEFLKRNKEGFFELNNIEVIDSVPQLSSSPNSSNKTKLYLDFYGESTFNGKVVEKINLDETHITISNGCYFTRQALLYSRWKAVVAIFSPFNVDVTTIKFDKKDHENNFVHVVVGSISSLQKTCGKGFLGSFGENKYNTEGVAQAWASSDELCNHGGNIVSHEIGHVMGLRHQSVGYYKNFPNQGGNRREWVLTEEYRKVDNYGRYPIMGEYFGDVKFGMWVDGGNTNGRNNLGKIVNEYEVLKEKFGLRQDDHGDTILESTSSFDLSEFHGSSRLKYREKAVIESKDDSDVFKILQLPKGVARINVSAPKFSVWLETSSSVGLELRVYDGTGNLIGRNLASSRTDTDCTIERIDTRVGEDLLIKVTGANGRSYNEDGELVYSDSQGDVGTYLLDVELIESYYDIEDFKKGVTYDDSVSFYAVVDRAASSMKRLYLLRVQEHSDGIALVLDLFEESLAEAHSDHELFSLDSVNYRFSGQMWSSPKLYPTLDRKLLYTMEADGNLKCITDSGDVIFESRTKVSDIATASSVRLNIDAGFLEIVRKNQDDDTITMYKGSNSPIISRGGYVSGGSTLSKGDYVIQNREHNMGISILFLFDSVPSGFQSNVFVFSIPRDAKEIFYTDFYGLTLNPLVYDDKFPLGSLDTEQLVFEENGDIILYGSSNEESPNIKVSEICGDSYLSEISGKVSSPNELFLESSMMLVAGEGFLNFGIKPSLVVKHRTELDQETTYLQGRIYDIGDNICVGY